MALLAPSSKIGTATCEQDAAPDTKAWRLSQAAFCVPADLCRGRLIGGKYLPDLGPDRGEIRDWLVPVICRRGAVQGCEPDGDDGIEIERRGRRKECPTWSTEMSVRTVDGTALQSEGNRLTIVATSPLTRVRHPPPLCLLPILRDACPGGATLTGQRTGKVLWFPVS